LRDGPEQATSTGPVDGLQAVVGAELVVQGPHVRPDRVHRHIKLAGDLRAERLVCRKRRTRVAAWLSGSGRCCGGSAAAPPTPAQAARISADKPLVYQALLDATAWLAAPIPGWAGFAIGHSIWRDPLRAQLRHLSTAGEARRRMSAVYVDYARYYLKAREGMLRDEPDVAP
jgi:hypothetical protein